VRNQAEKYFAGGGNEAMSANSNKQTDAMNNFLLLIKTSKSHVKSLSPRLLGEQVIALRNFIESQMLA